MQYLRLILSDKFIWLLTIAVLLAIFIPVSGSAAPIGRTVSSAGIFLIFLLHGIRLERAEVIAGMKNIRLQGAIFGFVFGVMLVVGLSASKLLENILLADLALGFLFLGVLPSTVQCKGQCCGIGGGYGLHKSRRDRGYTDIVCAARKRCGCNHHRRCYCADIDDLDLSWVRSCSAGCVRGC